ncbi:MAG: PHP domain-containing protein [Treponema sp.]|nr:PHP domain-containing protein [Treponema sp.]
MIDLHVHSNASDGQYSPAELVQMAKKKEFSAIAITDHDTVAGLKEGRTEAEKLGIIFVPGIEIEIDRPHCEFHLLGLGFQEIASELHTLIQSLQEKRLERNEQIVQKMNEAGVSATVEEIQAEFPNQVLGRPHFALWLEKHKIVKHKYDAFKKYLGRGCPWYVEKEGANLDEAIFAIKKSGGLPVLAHPFSLYLSWKNLDTELAHLKECGLAGVEAYHSGSKPSACSRLEELAKKHGFFVTAGSDFHGEKVQPTRFLGRTCANRKIDNRFYFEELLPALTKA